jgi:hypothetical protein
VHCEGRAPEEPLFPMLDARKTLKAINAIAGTSVQGHGSRATFASVAEGAGLGSGAQPRGVRSRQTVRSVQVTSMTGLTTLQRPPRQP